MQLEDGNVVVLRVDKHIKSVIRPLSEVNGQILDFLAIQHAQKQAENVGQLILKSAYNSDSQLQLLKQYNLSWKPVNHVTRDVNLLPGGVHDIVFGLNRIGEMQGLTVDNGDFALVYLKNIIPGSSKSLDKEQLSSIKQQISASRGMLEYNLYINKLQRDSKIVKY